MEYLTEVSAAGILAVIVLKTVFDFLKSREDADPDCEDAGARLASLDSSMAQIAASTAAVAELCSKVDSGGLPLIYRDAQSTQRLTTTLESLGRSVERLSDKVV